MNDTINHPELVERLAIFRSLNIGHKFLFVGPNHTDFAKFVKFDDGSAKALDDVMLPKGTICDFEHDETVHLLEDVRIMEDNIFNNKKYELFPNLDLIISTSENPNDYKPIGKVEIIYFDNGHIIRVHSYIGISTSWTEDEFKILNYSKLSRKIEDILSQNLVDKTNFIELTPILKKPTF